MESSPKSPLVKILWWLMQFFWYGTLAFSVIMVIAVAVMINKGALNHLPIPVNISVSIVGEMWGQEKNDEGKFTRVNDSPLAELWGANWADVVGFDMLVIDVRKPYARYVLYISFVLYWFGMLAVVWMLRRFVRNVRHGKHFSPENPRLIKWIGYLWLLGAVYTAITDSWLYGIYKTDLAAEGIKIVGGGVIPIPSQFAIPGLVILLIGQLMAEAVKLKEEADLTV